MSISTLWADLTPVSVQHCARHLLEGGELTFEGALVQAGPGLRADPILKRAFGREQDVEQHSLQNPLCKSPLRWVHSVSLLGLREHSCRPCRTAGNRPRKFTSVTAMSELVSLGLDMADEQDVDVNFGDFEADALYIFKRACLATHTVRPGKQFVVRYRSSDTSDLCMHGKQPAASIACGTLANLYLNPLLAGVFACLIKSSPGKDSPAWYVLQHLDQGGLQVQCAYRGTFGVSLDPHRMVVVPASSVDTLWWMQHDCRHAASQCVARWAPSDDVLKHHSQHFVVANVLLWD